MNRIKINADRFAKRMGAYSHGYRIDVGDSVLIFTTGQIALDNNGQVVHPNDAAKQAEFIYESLQKILEEAGSSLDDAVKTTVYLTDMNDFAKISPVRNKFLGKSEPVSTLVEVNKLVREGCKVEIEIVAIRKKQ